MTPRELHIATILARMLVLDEQSQYPDVQDLREVAREILAEQLRELDEIEPAPPPRASAVPRPRAG